MHLMRMLFLWPNHQLLSRYEMKCCFLATRVAFFEKLILLLTKYMLNFVRTQNLFLFQRYEILNFNNFFTRQKSKISFCTLYGERVKSSIGGQKSIFRPQRKSDILTLLGAKQTYQVASFHLLLS